MKTIASRILLLAALLLFPLTLSGQQLQQPTYVPPTQGLQYPYATVPGYTVHLNRTHAHYIAKEGTSHFCITREEYNRRLQRERDARRLEQNARQIQREMESLRKIATRK